MASNAAHVRVTVDSKPYRDWAAKHKIDAGKIERRLAGSKTTEPSSLFGAGLARAIYADPHMPDTKAHVQTVMRSQPYVDWSAKDANQIDHNKLLRRLKGERTTEPGSNFAKGLARLLVQPVRVKPPEPTDPPPPTKPQWPADKGEMAGLWTRQTVFVRALSSFHGNLRMAARVQGWSGLAVQLDGAYYVDANFRELHLIRSNLNASGWHVSGWGVSGQGEDSPFDEGVRHAGIARDLGLEGWIANMETWAESENWWKCSAWIDGWFAGGGDVPVAVSCMSSATSDWAREFDYHVWLDRLPGSAIFPQVYGATHTGYTVHNAIETLKRGHVPKNRVGLTFDVIMGNGPFDDYKTWPGVRSLYTGDDSKETTFSALART